MGLIQTAKCECKESNETITHFLLECPLYKKLRWEIWEDDQEEYEFILKEWNKLNEFVIKTRRFEQSIQENLAIMGKD